MVMPLTYSIAYGLIAGIGTYLVMEAVFMIFAMVGIKLPDDENAEISEKEDFLEGKVVPIGEDVEKTHPSDPVKNVEEEEVGEKEEVAEEAALEYDEEGQ